MRTDQTQHSKTFRKAFRLIEGGKKVSLACRKNIADAWLAIIGAHNTANDNIVRT